MPSTARSAAGRKHFVMNELHQSVSRTWKTYICFCKAHEPKEQHEPRLCITQRDLGWVHHANLFHANTCLLSEIRSAQGTYLVPSRIRQIVEFADPLHTTSHLSKGAEHDLSVYRTDLIHIMSTRSPIAHHVLLHPYSSVFSMLPWSYKCVLVFGSVCLSDGPFICVHFCVMDHRPF